MFPASSREVQSILAGTEWPPLCHCCLFVVAAPGICDENGANDFTLRDGTVTTDWKRLVQEWTVQQPGYTCQAVPEEQCPVSDSSHCQVLLSASFAECHKVIAPATFHTICQQDSCHQERVCEVIASYAHLCRTSGVCVDWRTTDFCGECLHVPLNLGDKPSIGPLTLSGLQSLICLMKIKKSLYFLLGITKLGSKEIANIEALQMQNFYIQIVGIRCFRHR
jgi:hypothetical protein